MKIKLIITLILLSSNLSFSQAFNYKWNKETGEVASFEKFVIKFNYMYTYDMDFEEKSQKFPTKFSLLIEKKDRYSNGRLVTLWDDKRDSFKILSCFHKTYKNSSEKYYQFKCENEYGAIIYYYLDVKSDWRLMIQLDNNQRMYLTKNSID